MQCIKLALVVVFFIINLWTIYSLNLPFSWDTVPIFAFPGAHDGFMTQQEIDQYNLSSFNQLLIWGFNVSCQSPINGSIYPADTSGSHYTCGGNHTFYANMEQSLQYEAKSTKEMIKPHNPDLIIFGYIEMTNAQESYVYQHLFNSQNNSLWWLTLQNIGAVNCYVDGCNWQGPAYRQYDFRQTDVINYFVNNVVTSLANSSYIDGIFLDTISDWVENLCDKWNCTQTEYNQLFNASLKATTVTTDKLNTMNKIVSISSHVDMYFKSDYYWEYRKIFNKYDNAIRYWEGLHSSFWSFMKTWLNETAANIPQHLHSGKMTNNPSWVELAAFLIGANNQSWFSYSHGWTIQSQWWQPQFNYSLGKPLNSANCTIDNNWYIFNNVNSVYKEVYPMQNSSDESIIFVGIYDSYQNCLNDIKKMNGNNKFGSFTWFHESDANFTRMCYARYGDQWYIQKNQNTTVSGHLGNMYCNRQFQYCSVQLDVLHYTANITWSD